MARPKGITKREIINRKIGAAVSKMTEENVNKLKEAFAIDCTIAQACDYADISNQTYYDWIKRKPELLGEFERSRQKLGFRAKYNIAQKIHGNDAELSKWYLTHKEPESYGEKVKVEHSGELATKTELTVSPELLAIKAKYEKELYEATSKSWDAKVESKESNENRK